MGFNKNKYKVNNNLIVTYFVIIFVVAHKALKKLGEIIYKQQASKMYNISRGE